MNGSAKDAERPGGRRVFVVEDHPITRRGLVELINDDPEFIVCGESDGSGNVIDLMQPLQPEIVLLDLTLPGKSGLMLIRDIRLMLSSVYVMAVSMHDETLYAERVLRAGGHGYVMKSADGTTILQAIRRVLSGEVYVSEAVSRSIVDIFAGRRPETANGILGRLSDREFEVFQLIGQGLASSEIGKRLFVSPKTVDSHRLHIMAKLKLNSLPELMRYAVRWAATEELI